MATLRIDLSCFFIVWSNCRWLDKISNVNTNTLQVLTVFFSPPLPLFVFDRDLKIENLLLDEQDNIKLIGNTTAPTFCSLVRLLFRTQIIIYLFPGLG